MTKIPSSTITVDAINKFSYQSLPSDSGKKAPEHLILWDSVSRNGIGVNGFGVKVTAGGKKTFILKRRVKDGNKWKTYQVSLGEIGIIALGEARELAREIIKQSNSTGLTPAETSDEKVRQQEAKHAARQAELSSQEQEKHRQEAFRSDYNLTKLCQAYWTLLENQKKISAKEARQVLELHVFKSHPDLAKRPAKDITKKDIMTILSSMMERGIQRTTGKVRSYLFAAYECALNAEGDPSLPRSFEKFEIEHNPVARVKNVGKSGRRKETLNEDDIKVWHAALLDMPKGCVQDALLANLYSGGQRIAQILRGTRDSHNSAEGIFTIQDTKGNRAHEPFIHEIPLARLGADLFKRLRADSKNNPSNWLFPDPKNPENQVKATKVSEVGNALAKELYENGAIGTPFRVCDIRRTVETLLARHDVTQHVRARLQSHGLSGVQVRHYDQHDYHHNKRKALTLWEKLLNANEAKNPLDSNIFELNRGRN